MGFKWTQGKEEFEEALDERLGVAVNRQWIASSEADDWYEFLLDFALGMGEFEGDVSSLVDGAVLGDFVAISYDAFSLAIHDRLDELKKSLRDAEKEGDTTEAEFIHSTIEDLEYALELAEDRKIYDLIGNEAFNNEIDEVGGYSIRDDNLMFEGKECVIISAY